MNDHERKDWIMNDEILYTAWRLSKRPLMPFIRENRPMIDRHIRTELGQDPKPNGAELALSTKVRPLYACL